ncbi:MAG: hypothetical protein ABIJ16_04655, partial [Bacteroidota bacterium]
DQVDGSDYVYLDHYIENNCCYDFSATPPVYQSDGTTTVWTPDNNPFGSLNMTFTFDEDLIIPENKKLIISDLTLKFTEGHGIIMNHVNDPFSNPGYFGSRLTLINAKLSSSCGSMWNGVTMAGNMGYSQFPVSVTKQPVLDMRNKSVIENAVTGIEALSGAVTLLNGCTFRNNRDGIYYSFFAGNQGPYLYRNASNIKNCTFITDDVLNDPALYPHAFVYLTQVSDIDITGCDFINSRPISPLYSEMTKRGHGILAEAANVKVKPHCNVIVPYGTECPDKDINTFTGLFYGVKTFSYLGTASTTVEESEFTDCFGISINGEDNYAVINRNKFNNGDWWLACGVYINAASVFFLDQNDFFNGDAAMVINNTEDNENKIYNNKFENVSNFANSTALVVMNDNANITGSIGLELKCNDFMDNPYSIAVNDGFIKQVQGGFLTPNSPAGNTFDISTNCQNGENAFYIDADPPFTIPEYTYHFNENGDITDISTCDSDVLFESETGFPYLKIISCKSTDFDSYQSIDQQSNALLSSLKTIHNLESMIDTLVDGGNTDYLLNQIAIVEQGTYLDLCDLLLVYSPYLSKEVLEAFVENDYHGKPVAKTEVLLANSPLPENALNKMTETWLPPPFFQTVMQNQEGINPTEMLLQKYDELVSSRENALNTLIVQCLQNDSVPEVKDSLRMVLASENDYRQKYKFIPYLISRNEFDEATIQLNDLELYANTLESDLQYEALDYIQLQRIIISIKTAPPGEFPRLVTKHYDFLYSLANSDKSRGTITAQNLLNHAGLANYMEKILLPDTLKPKSMKWGQEYRSEYQNSSESLYAIYPNPANVDVIIEHAIFDDDSFMGVIGVYDMKGHVLMTRDIENNIGYE